MEMLLEVGPRPRTLKAALRALQLAEARFTVALDWIKRFHGNLPVTFQTEVRNEEYFIRKSWESQPPKNNQSGHTNISEFPARVPVPTPASPDLGDGYNDWGTSNPVSPSPGDPLFISAACPVPALPDDTVKVELVAGDTVTTASHGAAGTVTTSRGLIKVVDIRQITDSSSDDIPMDMHQITDKSFVVKPIFITPTQHTCPHCPATFDSASALSVHSLVHVQLRLNRMKITQNRLENLHKYPRLFTIQYVNDKVVVVKRKAIPFNPKPKVFLPVSQLSPHNLETSLVQVHCEFCPRRFYSKTILASHVSSAHKTRIPRTCQFCPLSFPTGAERYEHVKANHAEHICHKCDKCGLSFLNSERLIRHLAMVHPHPSLAATCEVCGKVCKSAHVLKTHLKQSHPDPSQAVTCPTCGIQLKSARILKTHIKCHNPRSFLCQLCGFAAKNQAPLTNHMRVVHGTARPHKCPHCPLAFKIPASLRHHVDRHFGKNLVPCPHCDVRKSPKDMYNHVNIVHKGRKFKCAQCPAMFSLRAHLKNHYVLKHPEVTVPPDADLEVIYTKTPEDSAVRAPAPTKRKPGVSIGPRSVKPRPVGKLSCETCPGATFINNDEFELHIRRHEKDPEYKMKHRQIIQRLDQLPQTSRITEEYASSRALAEQEARPLQVEVHPVPVPMPPLLVEPPMHQYTDPQPQCPLVSGGTTLSQEHNLINPYSVDTEFPFYAL